MADVSFTVAWGAELEVCVADPELGARIEAALREATTVGDPPACAVARNGEDVAGKVVLIAAGRELLARVEAAEAAGAAGIQVVWTGRPQALEAEVFAVLEAWRGRKRRCPLVLAADEAPAAVLLRRIGGSASG